MTFTLLQMLNEKANKFANFQSKIAVVNKQVTLIQWIRTPFSERALL